MRAPHAILWVLIAVSSASLRSQGAVDWNKPFPPHKVIGNVYYVGTDQLATFLVTTPQGHILINSGFETTVPVIRTAM
jgi:metallo-beta-lactamase class B